MSKLNWITCVNAILKAKQYYSFIRSCNNGSPLASAFRFWKKADNVFRVHLTLVSIEILKIEN